MGGPRTKEYLAKEQLAQSKPKRVSEPRGLHLFEKSKRIRTIDIL